MSERSQPDVPREAVGLRYAGEESSAPRVVARGRGELAERILAVAEEHGVPVRRDPDLLQLLAISQVGEEIPTEVYGAVAQLISFLWRLNADGDANGTANETADGNPEGKADGNAKAAPAT